MNNGVRRILTALVAIPLVIWITYVGGRPFVGLVALIGILAQYELYDLAEKGGLPPLKWVGLGLGILCAFHVYIPYWAPLLLLAGIGLILYLPFMTGERPLSRLSITLFGVLYPTGLMSLLTDIRLLEHPLITDNQAFGFTVLVFALVWVTDTLAYYTGRSLGRHPLFPKVSPKKTWEGFIGGVVGAIVTAVVFKMVWLDVLNWVDVAILAFIGGIMSPLGDLAESRLKRSFKVKDSGGLLPGHGGFLDRFDAMVVAVPLIYLYLYYIVLP